MTVDLIALLQPIVQGLQDRAARDPEFRDQLVHWGRLLIALAEDADAVAESVVFTAPGAEPPEAAAAQVEPQPDAESGSHAAGDSLDALTLLLSQPPATPPPSTIPPSMRVSAPPSTEGIPTSPTAPSTLRLAPPSQPARVWRSIEVTDEELWMTESRCWIKAEASRWAATRQRRLADGADYRDEIEPQDRDLIAKAKALPDCFLWMSHRDGPSPTDLARFDDLAGCFEASAMGIALIRNLVHQPDEAPDVIEPALDLLAEAQSALRAAIGAIDWDGDRDQLRIFTWLKQTAAERQILIRRYMRRDDPADPAEWPDIQARIEALDGAIETARQRRKQSRSLMNKLHYHLKLIHESPRADHFHDWRKLLEAVDELVGIGVAPSSRDLRDILLADVDMIPDTIELTPNVQLVIREIDHFLASRPAAAESGTPLAAETSDEVRQVAALLGGKAMVLIGGERRRPAEDALVAAFGLGELLWLDTQVHQSYVTFEPFVARPDVAVVVLAIRWASHGFGDVKRFCDTYGKPLVRLPAGYSPHQVAHHILAQAGRQLGALEAEPEEGVIELA